MTHCSQSQLEGVADLLWGPLFENSSNTEETTRNVAAACLGKLATTHPKKYLPHLHVCEPPEFFSLYSDLSLQARVKDANPDTRATVVSAIRYTFAESSQSYDELLSPLLVDFLSLTTDENLVSYIYFS